MAAQEIFTKSDHRSDGRIAMQFQILEADYVRRPINSDAVVENQMTLEANGLCVGRARMRFFSFDAEYLQRLATRDAATESHFCGYFEKLVLNKLRARGVPREMAEDVCQETLLRVLRVVRRGVGIEHPERFGAFVNTVAHNVLLEFGRQQGRHPMLNEDAEEEVDNCPGADAALIIEERKRTVAGVLDELPCKDREILHLVFFQEADRESIARKFNVELGYLRVLLHRAKTRFQAAYTRREGAAAAYKISQND
jgi:RNA polymerase sigma-70 factor, ECF subfamily